MADSISYPDFAFTGNDINVYVSTDSQTINFIWLRILYYRFETQEVLLDELVKAEDRQSASFEISDYLKFDDTIAVNVHDANIISKKGDLLKYKLEYALTESRDDTPVYTSTPDIYCLQGGLTDDFIKNLDVLQTTWFDLFVVQQKKFLTWQPSTKYLQKDSKELLFWLVSVQYQDIKLVVSTFLNEVETVQEISTISSADLYEVLQLKVDPSSLNISDFDYYQVYLKNEFDEVISEVKTYFLDENYYNSVTKFAFQNSLGTYDTVTFTGNIIEDESFERNVQLRNSLRSQYYVDKDDIITASSGYIDRIWRDSKKGRYYLTELLFGRNAYTYDDNIMSEIIITSDNVSRNNNLENIRSLTIDYVPAKKKSFSVT